ncbi:MAG TPA: RidA family protein [Tepidisphaeraceae bacterium]|nr:RidA family protein [Tepidisphaeraceae bacterium]
MSVQFFKSGPGVPNSPLPFSAAVRAGDFVFISGQAAVDADGKVVSEDFEAEFRRTMENLKACLAAAGATLSQVVQVHSYVKHPEDVPLYNKLYIQYFKEPLPARTTIVQCLGLVKFEIDVVAYVGK